MDEEVSEFAEQEVSSRPVLPNLDTRACKMGNRDLFVLEDGLLCGVLSSCNVTAASRNINDIFVPWLDVGVERDRSGTGLRLLALFGAALCGVLGNATERLAARVSFAVLMIEVGV